MFEMLAFVHIEKTAGTSLIHILRHNYFLRYVDVRPFDKESLGLFTIKDYSKIRRVNPFLQAVGGHSIVPYNGMEQVESDINYITLLRDPIKRYISQYRHWVEKKHLDISVEQFMEHEDLWNFQTRKLVGNEDLEAAKSCLREKFITVGTVERFDEFLVLLRRAVGWDCFDIRYSIQNTAKDRFAMEGIMQQWGDEIRRRNEIDISLYAFILNELIPEQRASYGKGFDVDLEEFKAINNAGPKMIKRNIDYLARKLYIEPFTGGLRMLGGLPYKGSY